MIAMTTRPKKGTKGCPKNFVR